jgi:glycosyltransferase involved in cell wall biosynthesis
MSLTAVLVGPSRNVGGGVLAFCDNLERGLSRAGVPTDRMWVGTGRGDDNNITESTEGLKAFIQALPGVWATAGAGRVVHINTMFTQKGLVRDAIVYLVARLRGSRVLTQFHGGVPRDITGPFTRAAMRLLCNAESVVVINPRQVQHFRDIYPWLENRLHLIANAVDLPDLDLDTAIPRRLEHPRVIYVSRLVADKGLLETVRAIGVLRRRGVNLPMDVTGRGPAYESVQRAVREEGIEDLVHLLGHIPIQDKEAVLRNGTILSLPSYYKAEGQPIAIIEGFAWGLPVIGSNIEPVSFMIQEGVQGASVPPRNPEAVADAIQRLLANRDAYARIARHNRALADEQHNLERASKRFLELYRGADSSEQVTRVGATD